MISYERWLNAVFGRSAKKTGGSSVFAEPTPVKVEFICQTFLACGTELIRFSDRQIETGLDFIFRDLIFALKDPQVSVNDF